ncbi:SURF1 family protein [Streptomyces sp. SL13]|uniref:SURF1-like protein n=1 Tax=Streptantibioticus silvisoli TaxID=2705255 RepID=A0AA90HCI7_9ACTN|nr:SURF1 family protein [Streptantibioticus silvisoli]MDI5973220.1 SURF1 family protein [Streptantibioticus silvisoli]
MYRFLLTRQWVILTIVGLLMMPVMVRLGIWQMHRHEAENASNARIYAALAAAPVPVERIDAPRHRIPAADDFRTVTVTGTYDQAHEVVVRHRTSADDSSIGYYVVTPLLLADGKAVLVNRGWVASQYDGITFPKVPAAPKGRVSLTGRLRLDETTAGTGIQDKHDMPPRQVMLINSEELAGTVSRPVLGGYLELTATSPKPAAGQPQLVPPPNPGQTNGGYTPPHLAYAWQWWLFVLMVPAGWIILVRREHRDQVAKRDKARDAAAGPGDTGAGETGAGETAAAGSDDAGAAGAESAAGAGADGAGVSAGVRGTREGDAEDAAAKVTVPAAPGEGKAS